MSTQIVRSFGLGYPGKTIPNNGVNFRLFGGGVAGLSLKALSPTPVSVIMNARIYGAIGGVVDNVGMRKVSLVASNAYTFLKAVDTSKGPSRVLVSLCDNSGALVDLGSQTNIVAGDVLRISTVNSNAPLTNDTVKSFYEFPIVERAVGSYFYIDVGLSSTEIDSVTFIAAPAYRHIYNNKTFDGSAVYVKADVYRSGNLNEDKFKWLTHQQAVTQGAVLLPNEPYLPFNCYGETPKIYGFAAIVNSDSQDGNLVGGQTGI
jgi:hypothetical protein